MAQPFIPEHPEQLTPEWLTGVLLERGFLKSSKVVSVGREALGDGEGFLGVISRLTLTLDREEPGMPKTLIAKLPTQVKENRVMAELLGAYRREILFYEEFAEQVPMRLPVAYYAAFDAGHDRDKELEQAGRLDDVPTWLGGAIMWFARFITARRHYRYVLLIEDLAPGRVGDQLAGASPEDCAAVLAAIAAAHAKFWTSPMLEERSWLARQDVTPRMRHGMYLKGRKGFPARHPELIRDGLGKYIDWLDENGARVLVDLHRDAPQTLIHCDLRFDNVFFSDRDAEDGPTVFDWQLVGVGAAAYDVAYLLSGGLSADASPETVDGLLLGYHAALVENGVRDYPFDQFMRDYHRGLCVALTVVASSDSMQMGDDRGIELMDEWARRTFARIREVDPNQLL
ncbi:MAG: aminoglycoside phosphotransferase family protein [Myxococcota bacterium]